MTVEKLITEPVAPTETFDILGWIWYILEYLAWAVIYPFAYLYE